MKTLIICAMILPLLAQAQLFPHMARDVRPDQKNRSLFVRTTGNDDDVRDVLQLYASAVTTAIGTQLSLNAGSMFFRNPLPTQGKVSQTLRGLAGFDNYLTYRMTRKIINPRFWKPVTVDFVGLRTTRDYLDQQPKFDSEFERLGLKQYFDVLAPVFNGSVRYLPEDYLTNRDFIAEAHSSMTMQIATRYPTQRNEIRVNIPDNLQYLADSFTPLMVSGHVEVFPQNWNRPSKMRIVMILPRIGELITPENTLPDDWYIRPINQAKEMKSPPVLIQRISLGAKEIGSRPKNFAIKVTIDKDFSKPEEMEMTLDIGQLKVNSKRELGGIDFGEVEEGLVARGVFEKSPKVGVRLSFQRIGLHLQRPMTNRLSFENKYEFDIKVVPERSIKSIAVDVPQDDWWIRAKTIVGAGFGTCNIIEENVCTYQLNQVDGAGFGQLTKWMFGFVNSEADKSVQAMLPGAIKDADKSVDAAVASLLQQIDYGVQRLEGAFERLEKLNELPK
jgi:hypothetical protein